MTASTTAQNAPGRPQASQPTYPTILGVTDLLRDDRPIPIGSLAERLNLSRRQVEQALQSLAASGMYPVIAGPRGVYLASSPDEVDAYASALRARLTHQAHRIRGLRRCARAMRTIEQPTLGLVA